ncbi:hypothetical protein JCM16303_000098 [Sporobolomyces ruberrimus]
MSIQSYTYSSPSLSYACPPQTPSSASWSTLDLSPLINARDPLTTTDSRLLKRARTDSKVTTGPSCVVEFSGWKGSEGWVSGYLASSSNSTTWCCSLDSTGTDEGDSTCHEKRGNYDWEYVTLCSYGGLDREKEHSLKVMNNPAGEGSWLIIMDAASNGATVDQTKTTDLATIATVEKPASVDLDTYFSTTSSTSSTSSASSSPDPTSSSSSTSDSPSSTTSSSKPSSTLESSSQDSTEGGTNSTALFLVVAAGFLGIVVVCIIAALCLRTKPKTGRVGAVRIRSNSAEKHKRVGKRLLKRIESGESGESTGSDEDVEKGRRGKEKKKRKRGRSSGSSTDDLGETNEKGDTSEGKGESEDEVQESTREAGKKGQFLASFARVL